MKKIDFKDLQKYLHKIPDQSHGDDLLKKIHSMDAHTAYALLGGYLAPLLSAPKKVTTAPKLLNLEEIVRANVAEVAHGNLKNINSRIPSKLPEFEKQLKNILPKLEEYLKILPDTGEVDRDGHYRLGGTGPATRLYEEIYELVKKLREAIKKEAPENWELHPGLRKKYNELLSLLSGFVQPWEGRWVLSPGDAKFLIADIKKALKELYENREEQEERAIKDLEDRLKNLVKNKDEKIGELDQKVRDLTNKETSNKDSIATLERKIGNLEIEKGKDQNKILEKDREIVDLKQQIKNLNKDVEGLETKREENEKTIADLNQQIETRKKENEGTIADLKQQIKNLNKDVSGLETKREENEKTIADLNQQIELRKKENERTIADLKQQIEEMNNEISTLGRRKEEDSTTIAELTKRMAKLEKEKLARDTQISDLKTKLQEAEEELTIVTTAKEAAMNELKRQIEKRDKEILDLRKEINGLQKKIKDQEILDKKIADLQKEKEELERTKGGEITDLKGRIMDLDKRIFELEKLKKAEITALQKDLQKVREDLKGKEKEIRDAKIEDMGKELPDLEKLVENLEKEGIDIKDWSNLRDKLDDLNRLTKREKDAVKDIGDLQKNIEELREELEKQRLVVLEKQEKENEIANREKKLDQLYLEILKLRRDLGDLESLKGRELKNFRDKLDALDERKGKVGDSDEKIQSLQDEIGKLRQELDKDKQGEINKQIKRREKEEEIQQKERKGRLREVKEIELKELKKKQGMMDAYVFMIVVFLTQLHTRQAEKLKTHGETLQKISRIFDQWNVIQKNLNTLSQSAKSIRQWMKEGKVDRNDNLFTDATLTKRETDPRKLAIWDTFTSFLPTLQKNVKELRKILDEIKRDLPDSATSLLNTMYKLSGRLLDIPDPKVIPREITQSNEIENLQKENEDLRKVANELTVEMSAIRIMVGGTRWNMPDGMLRDLAPESFKLKQKWNELWRKRNKIFTEINANNEKIKVKELELKERQREKITLPSKNLTILEWMVDSDQTRFKSYMDTLAQGVTALTSISNMTQQELQIDTQYYNSLLGLQKAGFDSLNRTVQGILANLR